MRIFWTKAIKFVAASEDPPPNPHWPMTAWCFAPRSSHTVTAHCRVRF